MFVYEKCPGFWIWNANVCATLTKYSRIFFISVIVYWMLCTKPSTQPAHFKDEWRYFISRPIIVYLVLAFCCCCYFGRILSSLPFGWYVIALPIQNTKAPQVNPLVGINKNAVNKEFSLKRKIKKIWNHSILEKALSVFRTPSGLKLNSWRNIRFRIQHQQPVSTTMQLNVISMH